MVPPPPSHPPRPAQDSPEVLARVTGTLDLVNKIAHQLRRQISTALVFEDLVSYGREGLLAAARGFDESRGVPFRCFATIRIRGSMIDGLRSSGSMPRRAYRRLRAIEAADHVQEALVEEDAAKPPPDPKTAESRLEQYIAGMATAMAVGYLTTGPRENFDPDEGREITPEDVVARAEVVRQMRESVAKLPDPERRLVERHYFDEVTIDEAARELNLSKSWGSRLHARAIEFIARDMKRAGVRGL